MVNKAMTNSEEHTIYGVPYDNRQSAFSQFEAHMRRVGSPERVNLLCSAAYKGSGKTILLQINMKWFVNATRGIAIYVTFNDDQCGGRGFWRSQYIVNELDFERALAVRMLHRLVEDNENSNYDSMLRKFDATLSDIVDSFSRPIPQTVELVRRVLGVPESTKVMLAVDEIANAPKDEAPLTPEMILQLLAGRMDEDSTL